MKDVVTDDLSREIQAARNMLAAFADDDVEYQHDIIEGETSLLEALAVALDEIDRCDIITMGCAKKIEEIKARQSKYKLRKERVKSLIEQAMSICEQETIRLPLATLTARKTPSKPLIDQEDLIPSRFWKTPAPVLDKTAINEAFKKGDMIPGVTASNGGISLTIRRK